jgi:CelD/BcsL family acetyltransferase involved in cellulose biosynthesis
VGAWWQSFGAGKKLHVLVVKTGDRPVAIAPLMMAEGRMYGIKVRKLQFIANVHTPRFDLIVAGRLPEAYRAIWNHLAAEADRWDVLEWSQILFDSKTLEEVPRLAAADRFSTGAWHSEDCPCVEFAGGWNAMLKRLSHNHRAQMGKRLRRLGRTGPVRLEVIAARDDVIEAVEDGLRIEAAAWKARAGTAILCRPELTRFYRQIADEGARLGILRLIFLNVGGNRIAFAFALCHKNKLYVLKSGYRPEHAAYSPYLLLCFLLFRQAAENGLAEYEFLGAGDAWKLRWTQKIKPQYWLYVFSRKLRARAIHAVKFTALPVVRRRLGPLARSAGLKLAIGFVSVLQLAAV